MSFAENFWTHDYKSGPAVLFDQLYEGIAENNDFISLFRSRLDSELLYGTQLSSIKNYKSSSGRQLNDDYVSSIKNSYQKINDSFVREGDIHLEIAESIKHLVVDPFSNWCQEHQQRVEYSQQTITDSQKNYRNAKLSLEKLQKKYFNRCRLLEEFKSHFSEEELNEVTSEISGNSGENQPESQFEDIIYTLGGQEYDLSATKKLLQEMLENIPLQSHKVAILGTYNNVSTGSSITQWLMDNLKLSIIQAEEFGQSLIENGFLRLIGTMNGKNFINSSQFWYQWKPLAFETAGLTSSENQTLGTNPSISTYFEDVKQAIGVNSVDFKDKSQLPKLSKEVDKLDEQYYNATVALDQQRCALEELLMDHLTFMQKCELDRLRAIKKATFDFLACISNKIGALKGHTDELLLLEETIHPTADLKILIENYATGHFHPQVILYDNYYDSNVKQTFGVDLGTLSRLGRRVVPLVVQGILSYLDSIYPDLENDEERIKLWTQPVQLNKVHALRFELNTLNDINQIMETLGKYEPIIVTNTFKLYLMELPDPVIPYSNYDLIKSLYQNYPPSNKDDDEVNTQRINGIQNVLLELPKCNIATLDAILTHLTRLIHIIGTKNKEIALDLENKLSKEIAGLISRPKSEALELSDKHNIQFINDLFQNKDTIFTELRRMSSTRVNKQQTHSKVSASETKQQTVEASKNRLESKLQRAVSNSSTKKNSESKPQDEVGTKSDKKKEKKKDLKVIKTSQSKTDLKNSSSNKSSRSNSSESIVSSRPARKDILVDNTSELGQTKFSPSVGRRTSVKDLASRFNSPSPEKK